MSIVRAVLLIGVEAVVLFATTRLYLGWSYAAIAGLFLLGIAFTAGSIWLYKRIYQEDDHL